MTDGVNQYTRALARREAKQWRVALKVGDEVLIYDPATRGTSLQQVTKALSKHVDAGGGRFRRASGQEDRDDGAWSRQLVKPPPKGPPSP